MTASFSDIDSVILGSGRRIRTKRWMARSPSANYDAEWSAWVDGEESRQGWGRTETEAIENLKSKSP